MAVINESVRITKLLSAATGTGAGDVCSMRDGDPQRTFQAVVSGTGAVTATVTVEVSNDGSNWDVMATITLSGTTSDSDGYASSAPWAFVRGNVTAITGTGAAVTLNMCRG